MFRIIGLGLLLCAWGYTPAMAGASLNMRSVLEQKVRTYQAAKDCKAMAGLFYTQGLDKARKKIFARTIKDFICSNFDRKITSVAFQSVDAAAQKQPSDFAGKPSAFTLTPEGVIVIDYGRGAPEQPKSLSFLYGENEGNAYLITTKNADEE